MTWLAWRQFRTPAYFATAGLVVVAIALAALPLGHQIALCAGTDGCPYVAPAHFGVTHVHLLRFLSTFLVGLPALLGAFWGAPLVARELTAGTHRMVWTQSVTRVRWLAIKIAVVGLACAATCGLYSLILGLATPASVEHGRLATAMFAERGIVPIGYAVFAFAIGVVAGLLLRHTVPAMAVTLLGFFAVRLGIQSGLRAHLASASHQAFPLGQDIGIGQVGANLQLIPSPPAIPGAWVTNTQIVDAAGHAPTATFLNHSCLATSLPGPPPPGAGNRVRVPRGSARDIQSCIHQLGSQFHEVATYQPASHYWTLQILETAIFAALGLVVLGVGFWRLGRTS